MHTQRHRQNNNTIGLPTAQSKSAPRDNVSFVVVVDVIVFVVVVVVAVVVYHVHWHFKAEFCLHAALSLPLSLSLAHCRCLLATACAAAAASASLLVIVLSLYVLSLCVPFLRNKHRWLRLRGAPDKSSALKERAQKRGPESERETRSTAQRESSAAADSRQTKANRFFAIYFCPCSGNVGAVAPSTAPSGHAPHALFTAHYIITKYLL